MPTGVDRPAILVEGQQQLFRALKQADRETRLFIRHEFRDVAKPVARDAEALALSQIRNMPQSPKWAKMRIGVTQKLVYVAPRQRGARRRRSGRRPNLADLMMRRAMEPALDMNRTQINRRLELAFDEITARFNRGGIRL